MIDSKERLKEMAIGALAGFLGGLAVAIGGAIKDSPYEGFKPLTFVRSPIIASIEGAVLQPAFKANPVLTGLGAIATERITVEGYKLLRSKKPGKFDVGEWGVPLVTDAVGYA